MNKYEWEKIWDEIGESLWGGPMKPQRLLNLVDKQIAIEAEAPLSQVGYAILFTVEIGQM